jgi:hypothetical protein
VTNGKSLFIEKIDGRSPYARRWRDIVAEITNDLGGGDLLSEGQKQLIRRAATIAVSCERLEQKALTDGRSILDAEPGANGGGPSPLQILQEAAKILHAVARRNMRGMTTAAVADLPREEQDRVADLLVKASDIAAKAHIAARLLLAGWQRASSLRRAKSESGAVGMNRNNLRQPVRRVSFPSGDRRFFDIAAFAASGSVAGRSRRIGHDAGTAPLIGVAAPIGMSAKLVALFAMIWLVFAVTVTGFIVIPLLLTELHLW